MSKTEMTTPICDFLRDYANSGISRFHMPGHKGTAFDAHGIAADTIISSGSGKLLYSHDITEIKGADSLYEASGIIRESENNASRLFGTAATFYSTEGSSQCIRGMLALATDFGKKPVVLAARNVHRAFISAAALLDLDVRWLMPEEGAYSQCACPVTADQVRSALSGMEKLPAAVYLTSPDYLGNLADISAIADAVHGFGIPLLVDNAHGAYLHFLEMPIHPMDLGADMCCDSAHKTLPALTGCAYLHISRRYANCFHAPASLRPGDFLDGIDGSKEDSCLTFLAAIVRRAMSLFGSSSPSYLLLESLDRTNQILATTWREQLAACIFQTDACKASLREMGWHITGEPLKITIEASYSGYSGRELADLLRSHQIECEYADPDYVVLMVSPYNTQGDFDRLLEALKAVTFSKPKDAPASMIVSQPKISQPDNSQPDVSQPDISQPDAALASARQKERVALTLSLPEKSLSIREAAFANPISVPVDKSVGRICADLAISCPPAVPIVVCGERIPAEVLPVFRYYGISHIDVVPDPTTKLV